MVYHSPHFSASAIALEAPNIQQAKGYSDHDLYDGWLVSN